MTIQEYFGDWSRVIDLQEADRILKKVGMMSHHDNKIICPCLKDIFKAFRLCPLRKLQCVILGEDPYNNLRPVGSDSVTTLIPVATGLAFANHPDTPEGQFSPSLEVLRESVIDYTLPHGTIIFDPSLEKWASQGVLLLNAALSCEAGKAGSHLLLWRPFISSLLSHLSQNYAGIVYVLMGAVAQSFEGYINRQDNVVLNTRHPAYYARNSGKLPHTLWYLINKAVTDASGEQIKWYEEY